MDREGVMSMHERLATRDTQSTAVVRTVTSSLGVGKHWSHVDSLIARFPPKMGLKYLTGFWCAPWIIKRQFSYWQIDRVKFKIANKPQGDYACAYWMGMTDAEGKRSGTSALGTPYKELKITPEWFLEKGYPIPEDGKEKEV